jgi:metacaspase-1
MTKAISINIGLNNVDPNAYNGWDGSLAGCVNDAQAMKGIADSLGYLSILILNGEATANRIISEIGQAAWNLEENGILLLTYSGHGGQVPDVNGDEDDGKDETWVLYDRQLIDDELTNLWNQFNSGARIFVLSDSCHSGTVTKNFEYLSVAKSEALTRRYITRSGPPRFRAIPEETGAKNYQDNKAMYNALQMASGSRKRSAMNACVLLISGCQDNQLSNDGDNNGLFTGNLLSVWNNGGFSGNYRAFHQAIMNQMPGTQTPNYSLVGASNPAFEEQNPFTVEAPLTVSLNGNSNNGSQSTWPSIQGPKSIMRNAAPPSFTLNAGQGRYFVVEVATSSDKFDSSNPRSSTDFYGSWSDTSLMQGNKYNLPQRVWTQLNSSNRLYYRIGSTINSNYDSYKVSSADDDGEAIPSVMIID